METWLTESLRRRVSEADIEKSDKRKKELIAKVKEGSKLEIQKRVIRDARWLDEQGLKKAIFLNDKPEIARLREKELKSRHAIGDIETKFNSEVAALQAELETSNFTLRKISVMALDDLYHSPELQIRWDLEEVEKWMKDSKSRGIFEFNKYQIKTNSNAVNLAKQEISTFIRNVGGVVSSASRSHWICGKESGTFRSFSIGEIFMATTDFEKKLGSIDITAMETMLIDEGQLQALKLQAA